MPNKDVSKEKENKILYPNSFSFPNKVMEEFCKVFMEAPFLQEVVLFLIITYIHQHKQLIVLTRAYCVPVREKIISLDHECLLKPYSKRKDMAERQESILNCNDIGDIPMSCLIAMLPAQDILGKSPARTDTGGALG